MQSIAINVCFSTSISKKTCGLLSGRLGLKLLSQIAVFKQPSVLDLGEKKGIRHVKTMPLISTGSVPEHAEKQDQGGSANSGPPGKQLLKQVVVIFPGLHLATLKEACRRTDESGIFRGRFSSCSHIDTFFKHWRIAIHTKQLNLEKN